MSATGRVQRQGRASVEDKGEESTLANPCDAGPGSCLWTKDPASPVRVDAPTRLLESPTPAALMGTDYFGPSTSVLNSLSILWEVGRAHFTDGKTKAVEIQPLAQGQRAGVQQSQDLDPRILNPEATCFPALRTGLWPPPSPQSQPGVSRTARSLTWPLSHCSCLYPQKCKHRTENPVGLSTIQIQRE